MTAPLPAKVTATLAHVQHREGWHIYRLEDTRGYTHARDTIRVAWRSDEGRYEVETLRRDGWTPLLAGPEHRSREHGHNAGILAAVAVLYGMEDHG